MKPRNSLDSYRDTDQTWSNFDCTKIHELNTLSIKI
jgi:hypothetical protein